MTKIIRWFRRLFQRGVQVIPDGRGYRVNGDWVGSQKEVRERLEALGLPESEIIRLLQALNREKYGDAQR